MGLASLCQRPRSHQVGSGYVEGVDLKQRYVNPGSGIHGLFPVGTLVTS